MPTYKTKAIILSSCPYREHDRIVSFYSKEYGRIDARARGCRKLESKLAGHLEPFIETELLLARGRRWDILAGSRTVAARARLRSRLESAAAASVCCEALRHVSKPMSPDARVWELLRRTLSALPFASGRDIVYRFLWNLLSLAGFAPEIKKCVHCRRRVNAGYFSNEGGGVLCADCCGRDPLAVKMAREDLTMLCDVSGEPAGLPAAGSGTWDKAERDMDLLPEGRTISAAGSGTWDKAERDMDLLPEGRTISAAGREIIIGWWRAVVNHAPLRSLEFWETVSNQISNQPNF